MNTELPLYIVDAFTKNAFAGNSAAICLLRNDQVISDEVMQKIAAEMNLSETAFIILIKAEDAFNSSIRFKLRWFTPTCEVPLCGHATLASASVLINIFKNENKSIEFQTASGILTAEQTCDGMICIDLPSYSVEETTNDEFSNLVKATVGELPVKHALLSKSGKLLIRLEDTITRKELEQIKPKESELLAIELNKQLLGVIVTLRGSTEISHHYDFVSRYFAPWLGILEDPVTGSAHSVLAPYWANVLGKNELYARQCSSRGGDLKIVVQPGRILISGDTTIVVKGTISV